MQLPLFILLNFAALLPVYYFDRKNISTHIGLGITGHVLIYFVEFVPLLLGFWEYNIGPQIWKYPPLIFLLYFPFLSFSYFFANKIFGLEK